MKHWTVIFLTALLAVSCKFAENFRNSATDLFRGETVARVGEHRLHRGELDHYIPTGVSAEDSARLARRYIEAWAQDLLLLDMAQEQLSASEKDVKKELEEYRRALLKYRYGQLYIDSRLDTLVTEEETERYYAANPDRFRLDRPIVKARYLIIPADSKSLGVLKKKMSSEDLVEVMEADSLAATVAIKYVDSSESWMDAFVLAQEMGTDYRALVSSLKNQFAQIPDEAGNLRIAYICEMVPEGKTAPLEYCSDRVRDFILSGRKHDLEVTLEKELMEDARSSGKFVIY